MTEKKKTSTDTPISDVYANPQDTQAGSAAAEDQERVERGEEPLFTPEDAPRPGDKAEPAE